MVDRRKIGQDPLTNPLLWLQLIITVVALIYLLSWAQVVVMPLVLAIFLAFVLDPLIKAMMAVRIPRLLAIFISFITTALIIFMIGFIAFQGTRDFRDKLPHYEQKFWKFSEKMAVEAGRQGFEWNIKNWRTQIDVPSISRFLFSSLGNFITFCSYLIIVFVFTLFILLEKEKMPDKVIAAFGQQRGEIILETIEKVNSNIPTYLFYKTLISMITGLLVTFMLKFFQIDFAVLWGLIAFLLNFIPNLGSIVAGFPPILLTLIQTESFTMTFIIFFCFFMIQMVIGQILDPRILGASLNISPIVIFFSLLFWGWLWGIVGMILCIPIADTIRIVCGNIPKLQWFSILISNTIETPKSAE